mmetsp:Transcript_151986/g.487932  ORF Transcript_151986/g.487932 Transcript_151986/m.487932 type:complete len:582 (-) Transcript_151986:208-1953(-)
MASVGSLPSLPARRRGYDHHEVQVFGRGGPNDWAPPPLPKCASMMPKKFDSQRKDAAKQRLRLKQEEVDRLDFHGFGGDIEGLRAFLIHKFGGSVRGWRKAIAPDEVGTGSVLLSDFCSGLKKIGYAGQAMTLWKALTRAAGGSTSVGLEHFEPDFAEQLDALAKTLVARFEGGALQAWGSMERDHLGRANFSEFERFVNAQKLIPRHADVHLRRVFEALDMRGLGTISKEDFLFFDHWAYRRFGTPLSPEEELGEREEAEPWSPPRRPPTPEPSLDDFRKFLSQKYVTPARAWRVAIDLRGVGAIASPDFGKGCRAVGWKHKHHGLFKELAANGGGLATMRTLDPDTAAAIDELNEIISKKYGGDIHELWSQALDPADTGMVGRAEFVSEVAVELGMKAEAAKLLFNVLDTNGSGYIAEGELMFVEVCESQLSQMLRSHQRRQEAPASMFHSVSSPALSTSSSPHAALLSSFAPTEKANIASPMKSTRGAQARAFANTHRIKHMFVADSIHQHCRSKTTEMVEELRYVNHLAMRSTPQGDVFRHTSQFYREGVKRLQVLQKPPQEESDEESEDEVEEDEG